MRSVLQAVTAHPKFIVLGAAVALLVFIRFADLASAPFINDEPQLQLMVDQHLAAHTLPRHGLLGTRGIAYGPTALWIYTPLRLISDDVLWITALHVSLHCLGLVLVFLAIRTSVGLETALWSALLIASSPYLFFYARLAWDNTFLIPLTALTLFCLARLERDATRLGAWIGLGLAAGLVFNLHLMALPVIAAAALAALPIAWRNRRRPRALIGLALSPLTLALTVAPYLQVVGPSLRQGSQAQLTSEALSHALPETLLGTGTYLSAAGMEYFLTDATSSIVERLGPLALGFQLAWIVRLVAWLWLGLSLLRAAATWLRRRDVSLPTFPVVAQFGVAYFLLLLAYYYLVRPYPFHPHYFMSSFWLLPFFAAWLITESAAWANANGGRPARALSRALQAVIALLALCNFAFVAIAHAEIVQNHGTREVHYSSTRAEVQSATRDMCKLARSHKSTHVIADLSAAPGVLPSPFIWFSQHLPECAGIAISYGRAAGSVPPGMLAVRVSYTDRSTRDARLVVGAR